MIERLLDLLRTGGVRQVADMAHELETTPALVEMMLEHLEQTGHLMRPDGGTGGQGCGGAEVQGSQERCAACALAGSCAALGGGRVWVLTEKAIHDKR